MNIIITLPEEIILTIFSYNLRDLLNNLDIVNQIIKGKEFWFWKCCYENLQYNNYCKSYYKESLFNEQYRFKDLINITNLTNEQNKNHILNAESLHYRERVIIFLNDVSRMEKLKTNYVKYESKYLNGSKYKSYFISIRSLYDQNRNIYIKNFCFEDLDILDGLEIATLHINNSLLLKNINTLTHFNQLRELNLKNNNITTIPNLSSLIILNKLDLSKNNISDIRGVNNCISLRLLDISDNNISDISVLTHMPRLEYLYMEGNKITKLSSLINFENLMTVYADINQCEDIEQINKAYDISFYTCRLKLNSSKD